MTQHLTPASPTLFTALADKQMAHLTFAQRREMERKLKAAWPQYRTGNETFDAIVRVFGPAELRAQAPALPS